MSVAVVRTCDDILGRLETHGQTHVLRFHDELPPPLRSALLEQIDGIDLEWLAGEWRRSEERPASASEIVPANYYPAPPRGADRASDAHRTAGEELIRAGRVAVLTVAGGQGTRLGWNGPKGTYPATVVTGKPLFRCQAEQIIAVERRYRVTIPWYIMTSPANDTATRTFFADNNHFGLIPSNVVTFPQGMVPSVEAETGRLLLAEKHRIAMNPDGHGGSIKALASSGAIADMRRRGIEHISYVQIDNPLVTIVDPAFIGLHASAPDSSAQMSSKMVVKTDPNEKVGVFVRAGGRTKVIEYSALPDELATARDDDGRLRFRAGSIAVHVLSVAFVEELTDGGFALPYHHARKRVPYVDADGRGVEPETPNAIKLETFVFDALPFATGSIVSETRRADEFAPIKNATGADSPATSHQLQSDRAGRWLEDHGVRVPRDAAGHVAARVEISPLTALEPSDLVAIDLPKSVAAGGELAL